MYKIAVAGAGHGGLSAAINLAKSGNEVTVYEKGERDNLGYDWPDCISTTAFDFAGFPAPDESMMKPFGEICYLNPSKSVLIKPESTRRNSTLFHIERKVLISHLLSVAENSGVKLVFGETALGALVQGGKVTGLRTDKGEYPCDLLIDAAGMDSPVRKSLPESFGIAKEITGDDVMFTYRAIYENTGIPDDLPSYCAYFYHSGNCGFDWVINEEDCVDVLVGSIAKINDEIIGNALDDFRIDHPCLSDSVIRGGDICKIPLRRTLARFTAPGYAAVGDSASMIDPLSGSGISHSIEAGAILAKVVDSAAGKELTEDILWQFQYDYFRRFSSNQLSDDAIKLFMLGAGEEKLNAVFDKKIVTAKEFYVGKQTVKDILQKAGGIISTPSLIPSLFTLISRKMKITSVLKSLPEKYDESAVSFWADAYEAI